MAKRPRKSSSSTRWDSFPTIDMSVESAWRDAIAVGNVGNNERARSKKRLAEAIAAKAQAESDAVTATKDYCATARRQADDYFQQAERALASAERIKADAESRLAVRDEEIQHRLDDAAKRRKNARAYADRIEDAARSAAEALMTQTREGASEMATRMRKETAQDIRKVMADIEVAREAAEQELEAQRLLTETARVRAFTVGLNAEAAQSELMQPAPISVKRTAIKKTAKKTTPSKTRSLSSTAKSRKPAARKSPAKRRPSAVRNAA